MAALLLTGIGVTFVVSSTMDPHGLWGLGGKGIKQLIWWGLGLSACAVCLHISDEVWSALAWPAVLVALVLQGFMLAAAGTALVPSIKGAHNWLVLGPINIQPSEFYKLALLLGLARLLSERDADAARWGYLFAAMALVGIPAALLAKEDLGSALTLGPLLFGVLFVAGIRAYQTGLLAAGAVGLIAAGYSVLRSVGQESYQWRRIQAWMDPDAYALTEGMQTLRSQRAIGSGQWFGKGWSEGDHNVLGWLPEKHTDMIFAVIGEEFGFFGALVVLVCYGLFAWCGVLAAMSCQAPFNRLVIAGYVSLVMGQMVINLAVVLGLIPVTGITLPFFSYGGSSLLALYVGLGICLSCSAGRRRRTLYQ